VDAKELRMVRKILKEHDTTPKKSNGCVTVLLLIFVVVPVIIAYSAFAVCIVLQQMWAWFVVPLGLPAISFGWAYGLGLIITWLTQSVETTTNINNKENGGKIFWSLMRPWTILLFGYVTMQIMTNWFPSQLPMNMIGG